MAKLIYSAITSLDGYVADENDNFDWAAPDAGRPPQLPKFGELRKLERAK